jgi:hypothetical protein
LEFAVFYSLLREKPHKWNNWDCFFFFQIKHYYFQSLTGIIKIALSGMVIARLTALNNNAPESG